MKLRTQKLLKRSILPFLGSGSLSWSRLAHTSTLLRRRMILGLILASCRTSNHSMPISSENTLPLCVHFVLHRSNHGPVFLDHFLSVLSLAWCLIRENELDPLVLDLVGEAELPKLELTFAWHSSEGVFVNEKLFKKHCLVIEKSSYWPTRVWMQIIFFQV